ncbi:MAG: anthranilate synthase component I family protein [Opitutaceae bacterium]
MTTPPFKESITLEQWRAWAQEGFTRLPVVLTRHEESLPENWSEFTSAPATVLLESAQSGRYTYLCDRPARIVMGHATLAEIWSAEGGTLLETKLGKPLEVLSALLAERKAPALAGGPAMQGGIMGIFGYDLVRTWERLPFRATRDLRLPLYALIETGELFIYDHDERTLRVVVWSEVTANAELISDQFRRAQAAVARAGTRWGSVAAGERAASRAVDATSSFQKDGSPSRPSDDAATAGTISPSFTSVDFQSAARRVLDYIGAGDTYQVNLSRRTSRATGLPPAAIYEALRKLNPSPYMGLLRLPQFALVCGSPELLVSLVNGVVRSRPIAGTRPRGDAALADAHFSADLFASEKERAEHLMLVDLIRNDIGRVAAFGSVKVPEFMVLERYSHVMHLVSQVEGRLAAGKTWVDVFQSMFPGGTITGCPKFRTMEIIEELEPVGRGFYTGALGWISYGGEMELNIVIRSMLVQDGIAHVQAGSGIVADSKPDRELDEATRKAQALWVALENAAERHGKR